MASTDQAPTPPADPSVPSVPEKFLFDTDFSAPSKVEEVLTEAGDFNTPSGTPSANTLEQAEPETPEVIIPTFSEEDLAKARAEGMQAGRDEATRDLTSAQEQRIANSLDTLNTQVTSLFDTFIQDRERHNVDAISVAMAMLKKLFPSLNDQYAAVETQNLITAAMKRTQNSPTLRVQVPAELHGEIETIVQDLAVKNHREGAIKINADPDMPIGDALVDWDGGGMLRDTARLWEEINTILERNLGSAPAQMLANLDAPPPEQIQEVVEPANVRENEPEIAESPPTEELAEESTEELVEDQAEDPTPEDQV